MVTSVFHNCINHTLYFHCALKVLLPSDTGMILMIVVQKVLWNGGAFVKLPSLNLSPRQSGWPQSGGGGIILPLAPLLPSSSSTWICLQRTFGFVALRRRGFVGRAAIYFYQGHREVGESSAKRAICRLHISSWSLANLFENLLIEPIIFRWQIFFDYFLTFES